MLPRTTWLMFLLSILREARRFGVLPGASIMPCGGRASVGLVGGMVYYLVKDG